VLAGMEMGLFPHSRSLNAPNAMEEERRLCYVGMTRAQKRLVMTHAKFRRRFGGGDQERSVPSPFLAEVPAHLTENLGQVDRPGEMDLYSERHNVRQAARAGNFTGKTYNSIDNISQFFSERGLPNQKQPPTPLPRPVYGSAAKPQPAPPAAAGPVRRVARTGSIVEHPKYGTGTVVRREGEGENAKITVNFPRFGLKKLVEKYAGLKRNG
jgi:ATP-dependent DNA helicase UvrD/PcrA